MGGDMVAVANRINQILEGKGKTPYWLAKETRISTQTIYKLIGKDVDIDDMKYKTVRLIASALNVDIEELRANEDRPVN